MLRGFIAGVLVLIVLEAVGAYGLLRSGLIPANADATPGRLQFWAAKPSLEATLARQAPKRPNPVALTDDHLMDGIKLYAAHCAVCHGAGGGGAAGAPRPPGPARQPPRQEQ